ncbi:protein FAR-RED IMPAIRED RESPONSE 1-like [Apium graveolens]|uniref:protein FAR-RED IMPAIRED RESPONSE 1-like n=1 Tax=Apium graveolens TaxID=4045 RepID=UPI003D7AC2A3
MSTTQRSESMNSFFDGYVNSKTTLKQFVEQYENALASKVSKENQEDFNSYNSMYPCITDYEMEKELQSFYTNSKFKEFQQEIKGKLYCEVSPVLSDGSKYLVVEDFKFGDFRRHAISLLIHKKIYHLPTRYISRRWRKDIKRVHTRVNIGYNAMSVNVEAKQFEKMCNAFHEVADLAREDDSKCTRVIRWINDLKGVLSVGNDFFHGSGPKSNENEVQINEPAAKNSAENVKISSPLVVRGKGRPPTRRKQSAIEKAVKKNKNRKKIVDDGTIASEAEEASVQISQWSEHQYQQVLPEQQALLQANSTPTIVPNCMLINMSFTEILAIQQQPPEQHWNANHVSCDIQQNQYPPYDELL